VVRLRTIIGARCYAGLMWRVLLLLMLAACAAPVFNSATNEPLSEATPPNMGSRQDFMHENSIMLSFSGGGLRAAAFAHGVLTALTQVKTADGDLLDDVAMISSVSGSSLAAAHYGVYGREGLARFRREVLLADFEGGLRLSPYSPANLSRILGGGLNAREDFSDRLDHAVFHGATFADIYRRERPDIRIHATDLYHRVPFPFIPALFSVLCSDLSRYSVAEAVTASLAVPVVFAPVVVRTYPDSCPPLPPAFIAALHERRRTSRLLNAVDRAMTAYRDPVRPRFIKLGDGGLTDNVAVSTLIGARLVYGTPYAPMTERDAVRIRRLLMIVVDASRQPSGDWTLQEAGPGGVELALSATDAAMDAAANQAADALIGMLREWQESVIAFRCSLAPADVARLGGPADWNCKDVKFSLAYLSADELDSPWRERIEVIPTRLTLDAAQVDATIEGARAGTFAIRAVREYIRGRVARDRR
jgi:NTE family protein